MIRRDKTVQLSKRLQVLADMVPQGAKIVDVGCDHGFLSIYLVQCGKVPGALAMDVRKGPLAAAAAHIKEVGLETVIETRLSDGLEAFEIGEAGTLVCAGMGGPLMQRILTACPEKTASFSAYLLQPQSEIREFRSFLRENGYRIVEERILLEDGKYYFPMLAVRAEPQEGTLEELWEESMERRRVPNLEKPQGEKLTDLHSGNSKEFQEICDRYGALLLRKKEPLLLQYLMEQKGILEAIESRLVAQGVSGGNAPWDEGGSWEEETKADGRQAGNAEERLEKAKEAGAENRRRERLLEVRMELEMLQKAMAWMR